MIDIRPENEKVLPRAAKRLDSVGVNYYFSEFVKKYHGDTEIVHNGIGEKGTDVNRMKGVSEKIHPRGLLATDRNWVAYLQGTHDQPKRVYDNYPLVHLIYITEDGTGHKNKPKGKNKIIDGILRIDYLEQHMEEAAKTVEAGIPVSGYFVWLLQDMFSWTNGYSKRYGLFYADSKTQKRYAKKSAYWYKGLVETQETPPVD